VSQASSPAGAVDLKALANVVAGKLSADVVLVNAPSRESVLRTFFKVMAGCEPRRENVFLILVTNGGDADAAYMTARYLQRNYKQVTVCINGSCYSAGTLTVLGAHEVVISDTGRLGPLDVQILKKDELGERLSGLTLNIAMDELTERTYLAFEQFLAELKSTFRSQVSLKTAMDLASRMATDLFSGVYRQIDPLKIGEDARAMQIAKHYGTLLETGSHNIKEKGIDRLLYLYPSHSCVIDREEAEQIFLRVRQPSAEEMELLYYLGFLSMDSSNDPDRALVTVLSDSLGTRNARQTARTHSKPKASSARGGNPSRNGKAGKTSALPDRRNATARGGGPETSG